MYTQKTLGDTPRERQQGPTRDLRHRENCSHLNRDSFRHSFKGLVALEIIIDLPFGFFPTNKHYLSRFFIVAPNERLLGARRV